MRRNFSPSPLSGSHLLNSFTRNFFYACLLGEIIILPNVNGIAGWKISTGYPWRSHELVTSRVDARERVRVNTTWTDVDDDRNRWRITSRIILRDDVSKWFDHPDACLSFDSITSKKFSLKDVSKWFSTSSIEKK